MKKKKQMAAFVLTTILLAGLAGGETPYDARIGENEILTPVPARTPRINGPKVYGARPGKVFIYRKPGQWNDPDFMYLHFLRDHTKNINPSREIPLNTNQRYQYVTLWSLIAAPLFFSCDMHKIDDFTLGLLANADVANLNQDELGHVAEVVRNRDHQVLLVKQLADGSRALGVFNTDGQDPAVVQVDWADVDACCEQTVYDVWRQKDLGVYKGGLSVRLSPHGVGCFRLRE